MLSAHKLGARQVEYYLSYAARGAESCWLGGAAHELGLSGTVTPEAFMALCRGEHPDGSGRRLLERVATRRVPGWDFTFSAPKSVSLAWALADEQRRQQLAAAHREAVAVALSYLEDAGGRARRGLGGRDGHVDASLAVACFTHPASRELDPQLHTHGIICNLGIGEDGRITSIDSRLLYRHRRATAALYRAELRSHVAGLGGAWRALDRRGLSELEAFAPETLRAFSRRRNAIEAMLAERGESGRAASEAACLATRKKKVGAELEELRTEWATRASAFGWDAARVAGVLDGTDRRTELDEQEIATETERLVGPRGLTRERSSFTSDDVLVAWASSCPQGASREELEHLTAEALAHGEVVSLDNPNTTGRSGPLRRIVRLVRTGTSMIADEPRYSTRQLLSVESRLMRLAREGQGKKAGQVERSEIEAVLAARPYLRAEQQAAVRAICGSGDLVSCVLGVPGSGKTFALEAARSAWVAAGHRVIGAALAAEAAAQLEAGARIASSTIDRLLYELCLPEECAGSRRLGPSDVVAVDEASMVDTRRLARLLDAVATAGAKLVLCGDDRQLPSIEAGGAFSALCRRLGAATLEENGRQVEAFEREALVALREGRTTEAASAYCRHGRVHQATSPGELLSAMVDSYWAARSKGEEAALFSYARSATRVLNHLARARADVDGRLSGPELVVEEWTAGGLAERVFRVGDELSCLRNRGRLGRSRDRVGNGVRNGTRGTVTAIDPTSQELTIATADGRAITLPADYVHRFTDYGYASTLHKGQGQTIGEASRASAVEDGRRRGRAFVFGAESLTAEAALVAASRATDSTELFVLVDPIEQGTTPDALGERLGQSWARGERQRLASEELQRASEIALLSRKAHRELAHEHNDLSSLIRSSARGSLLSRVDDARRRLGAVLVQRDEVIDEHRALEREIQSMQSIPTRQVLAHLYKARTRQATIERDADDAFADLLAIERQFTKQANIRRRLGSDVRRASDRLELVDSALSTKRQQDFDQLEADPPSYVVGLLGPKPVDPKLALRWRQGLIEIEDRRCAIVPSDESPYLGPKQLPLPPQTRGR